MYKMHKVLAHWASTIIFLSLICYSISVKASYSNIKLYSPNSSIILKVIEKDSCIYHRVNVDGNKVIKESRLGITFKEADFCKNLQIAKTERSSIDDTYEMLTCKRRINRNHANEISIAIKNVLQQTRVINFRAYNDGVAFNYQLGDAQKNMIALEEHTESHVNPVGYAWIQPYDWWSPAYEKVYENKISIGKVSQQHREDGWAYHALFQIEDSWMLITEVGPNGDYCATHLRNREDIPIYEVKYAIKEQGYKGGIIYPEITTPWISPWRIIIIGSLSDIFESNLLGDRAESYFALPDTIKDILSSVPTVWGESKLLSGYPGKSCIIARRNRDDWYIGGNQWVL